MKDPITFLNDIKKGKMSIQETNDKQENYYNYLKKIRKGNKSANQKRTLANINILFNARDNAIKFYEDYSSMILEAKKLAREQDNSESLLNEIRQIVYYLYRSKEITKVLYNNIINSIKA